MTSKIPDPIRIHPFIKLCRYSLLTAGILYGAGRKRVLQIKEAGRTEEKQKKRLDKAKKLEQEKLLAQERDLAEIIAIFTNKPVSSFLGPRMGGKGSEEEGVQTDRVTNVVSSQNEVTTKDMEMTEVHVSEKCDPVLSKIYEDDTKESFISAREYEERNNNTTDESNIGNTQKQECPINKG